MRLVHCVPKWLIIAANDAFCILATTCVQFFFPLICFKRAGQAVPLRLKGSHTHAHARAHAHTDTRLRLIKCIMKPVVFSIVLVLRFNQKSPSWYSESRVSKKSQHWRWHWHDLGLSFLVSAEEIHHRVCISTSLQLLFCEGLLYIITPPTPSVPTAEYLSFTKCIDICPESDTIEDFSHINSQGM